MTTLLLLAVLAQQDLDSALDDMAKASDAAAYVAARDRVLAMGNGVIDALKTRGAADQWTAAGWVRALCAESCRIRLANPALAAAADKPRGLDPAEYSKFRKPVPLPQRDLRRLGVEAVPLLLERWRWTFDAIAYSAGAAGDAERAALRQAILAVPGELADARACPFLKEILASGDESSRATAAVSLGQCGGAGALPSLTSVFDDRTQPPAVREACGRAMGRVPDAAALDAIRQRLAATDELASVRTGLVGALGILGSAGGWESRGQAYAQLAPVIRQGCAEALIDELKKPGADAAAIGEALAMVAWPDSLKAAEGATKDAKALEPLRAALSRRK